MNKIAHTTNGNIRNHIKLGTWNKGPSTFQNAVPNIRYLLEKYSIDILAVQELNLKDTDNEKQLTIPNYTLVHDKLRSKNQISRAGIFIHKSVKHVVRDDLTNQGEAHVAITAYITKTKKINVHAWYRQWNQMQGNHKIPDTGTTKAQKERMIATAEKFQKSKNESETVILSDTNINTNNIDSTNSQKTNRDKQTSQVARLLSDSILQEGFVTMNTTPTHLTSTIDHIFSTNPLHINNTTTIETHLSDHKLVTSNRMTKTPHRKPRYTTSRAYNTIDYIDMCQEMNQDPRLYKIMQSSDSNMIATHSDTSDKGQSGH